MKIKCYYCGNKATTKGYREWDGMVGKSLECTTCFNLDNEGVLNREAKFKEFMEKEDNFFDSAMDDFWNTINSMVFDNINDEQEWADLMYNNIGNKLKNDN